MEDQTILEKLGNKVSQVLEQHDRLKDENKMLRTEMVTIKAENEIKSKEIDKLTEENVMKDLEIEEIVEKIESILG